MAWLYIHLCDLGGRREVVKCACVNSLQLRVMEWQPPCAFSVWSACCPVVKGCVLLGSFHQTLMHFAVEGAERNCIIPEQTQPVRWISCLTDWSGGLMMCIVWTISVSSLLLIAYNGAILLCKWCDVDLTSYPGHLTPAFVACSTNVFQECVTRPGTSVHMISFTRPSPALTASKWALDIRLSWQCFLDSESCFTAVWKECVTPPHVQVRRCT